MKAQQLFEVLERSAILSEDWEKYQGCSRVLRIKSESKRNKEPTKITWRRTSATFRPNEDLFPKTKNKRKEENYLKRTVRTQSVINLLKKFWKYSPPWSARQGTRREHRSASQSQASRTGEQEVTVVIGIEASERRREEKGRGQALDSGQDCQRVGFGAGR